jgi:hypothetical protein
MKSNRVTSPGFKKCRTSLRKRGDEPLCWNALGEDNALFTSYFEKVISNVDKLTPYDLCGKWWNEYRI